MFRKVRLFLFLLIFHLLPAGPVSAADPGAMTPLGHWPSGSSYAFAQGDGLLIMTNGTAVDVYDVSTPGQRVLLTRLLYAPGFPRHVFYSAGHLYVAELDVGLHVYDMTDPSAPALVGTQTGLLSVWHGEIVGSYGYFIEDAHDLVILDFADPTDPVEIGRVYSFDSMTFLAVHGDVVYVDGHDQGLIFDVSDRTDPVPAGTLPLSWVNKIKIQGDHAFVTAGTAEETGFYALDLTTPLAPVSVGFVPVTPGSSSNFRAMCLSGGHAFVSSNLDSLWVMDISDPTAMTVATKVPDLGYGGWNQMGKSGNRLWMRHLNYGVSEVDISAPLAPVLTDVFPAGGHPEAMANDGATVFAAFETHLGIYDWSEPAAPVLLAQVEPVGQISSIMLAGDLAFLSDDGTGVRILDVGDPTDPQEIGLAPGEAGHAALLGQDTLVFIDGAQDLRFYDITDPTAPSPCGSYAATRDLRNLTTQGNLVFLADLGLTIVDATDPCAPQFLGEYYPPASFIFDVEVHGSYAYLAAYIDGLSVVSISDPTQPTLEATWNQWVGGTNFIPLTVHLDFPKLRVISEWFGATVFDVGDPLDPQLVGSIPFIQRFSSAIGSIGPNVTLLGEEDGLWYISDDFAVSAAPEPVPSLGQVVTLEGIHPNPFNPVAKIAYEMHADEAVDLRVFDLRGRLVKTLLDGEMPGRGRHEVQWDGKGKDGRTLPSGTYFFHLEAGRHTEVGRGELVK